MKAKPLLKTGMVIGAAGLGVYLLRRSLPYGLWIYPVKWLIKHGLAMHEKKSRELPENVTPLFRAD